MLKIQAISLGLIAIAVSVNGQINKRQFIVGGNASFLYSQTSGITNGVINDQKATGFQFTGGGGYFFINQLCSGIRIEIATLNTKEVADGREATAFQFYYSAKSNSTLLTFTPFVRYYFLPSKNKINIFGDISYSYNFTNENTYTFQSITTTDPNTGLPLQSASESFTKNKYHTNSFSIAAGPVLFINPKVSIELFLGYRRSSFAKRNFKSSNLLIGVGFQIHLGMGK